MAHESNESVLRETRDDKLCTCCVSRTSRIVECPFCRYRACVKCISTFLTTQIVDAACMSCHTTYPHEFMVDNFTQEFQKKVWPAHRKRVLFELEKNMLPETVPLLEHVRRIPEWQSEYHRLTGEINRLTVQRQDIERRIAQGKGMLNGTVDAKQMEAEDRKEEKKQDGDSEDEKRAPIACPVNDCRGFLNRLGKCGVCDAECCRECRELKNRNGQSEDHVCDPNTLATVKQLEKECRRCPKCSVYIFRIDGCDQMWCVKCHTAFNWRTGKVEKGRVHNPHYFQFMRDHAPEELAEDARRVNVDENVCEDAARHLHQRAIHVFNTLEPSLWRATAATWTDKLGRWADHFWNQTRSANYYSGFHFQYVYRRLVGLVDHIRYAHLENLPRPIDQRTNLDLRLKYLLHEINQDEFEKTVLRRQKLLTKQLEYREIVETFLQLYGERLVTLSRVFTTSPAETFGKAIQEFLDQVQTIERFTRTAIDRLNQVHGGRKMSQLRGVD